MSRRLLTAALAAALSIAAAAAAPLAHARGTERPLVHVIVVDALGPEFVGSGSAPFLTSLIRGDGARTAHFPAHRAVMPSETNPNHTAMMSGAFPGQSGVAANAFAIYRPLAGEDTCDPLGPLDPRAMPSPTTGENAGCPKAEFTFEAIRRQGNPNRIATAAIFGKPKLGRIFAGENVRRGRRDVDHLWAPCSSGTDDDDYCGNVLTNPVSGYAMTDAQVMDAVLRSVDRGVQRGDRMQRPGFTFVNLHQVDSAGHATGVSPAFHAAITLADAEIRRFVQRLKDRGEWERSVVIVVADHSMDSTPSRISMTPAFEAAGIDRSQFLASDNGGLNFIYLADRRARNRHALLARMREVALNQPGVARVFYREPNPRDGGTRHTVERQRPHWRPPGGRWGDLVLDSDPGVTFAEPNALSNPLPGNHGGEDTRGAFLAVTGGSPLIRHGEVPGQGRGGRTINVDIAPTVMGLLGLAAPRNNSGRFLQRAFDRRALRRSSRPYPPRSVRAKPRRGGVRVSWRKRGGAYDVERRRGGSWRRVEQGVHGQSARVPARRGERVVVRVRSRSAAGLASGWQRAAARAR